MTTRNTPQEEAADSTYELLGGPIKPSPGRTHDSFSNAHDALLQVEEPSGGSAAD